MALFGRNKKTEEKKATVAPTTSRETQGASPATIANLAHILSHARITEKASMHQGIGIYTFDISEKATKRDIIAAIRMLYKVTPRKVAVVTVPSKIRRSMRTGKTGVKKGGRKAYVYLKQGETIQI